MQRRCYNANSQIITRFARMIVKLPQFDIKKTRSFDLVFFGSASTPSLREFSSFRTKISSHLKRGNCLFGALKKIRTPDLLVRSQTLYPAELSAHIKFFLQRAEEDTLRRHFFDRSERCPKKLPCSRLHSSKTYRSF